MANKEMLLGSGDLYISAYSGSIGADATIETDANRIGGIKGGATLSYTPTIYSVSDDMRRMKKNLVTAEEVIFKSGFLSFDLGEVAKLALSSKIETDAEAGKETLSVGGQANIKEYVLRFVHTFADGTKLRCTLVGVPTAGFELAFSPENESVINAEFSAVPMDNNGTLYKLEKEVS